MKAEYTNEYGDIEECIWIASSIINNLVLVEIDGVRGWCSGHLVIDNL